MSTAKKRQVYGPDEVSKRADEEDRTREYVPRAEGEAAGWLRVGRYDSPRRRALWIRFVELDDESIESQCKAIEMCAGREGDDAFVRLTPGMRITPRVWFELQDVLMRAVDHLPARWRGKEDDRG